MPAAPEPEPDLPGQTGADPEAEPGGAAEGVEAGPLQGPADGPGAAPLPAPAPPPLPPRPPVPKAGNPVPDYPRAARRQGIEGVVVAKILVRADGTVAKVWILSGPEIFHEAVTEALRSYRYEPARLASGTAIAAHHTVSFPFALAQTR